jgi:hypothetical protein
MLVLLILLFPSSEEILLQAAGQAMTKQLDKWLIECARKLNDRKILAVLNGGDVVAQYHYFCLTALYNKERATS